MNAHLMRCATTLLGPDLCLGTCRNGPPGHDRHRALAQAFRASMASAWPCCERVGWSVWPSNWCHTLAIVVGRSRRLRRASKNGGTTFQPGDAAIRFRAMCITHMGLCVSPCPSEATLSLNPGPCL